ncbi:MAG: hypothetical protein WCK93_08400 [Nitrosomonadales bacterium]
MLRNLFGLMLVKHADDTAHHFAASVIAGWLCDGYDLNLVLGKLAFIDAKLNAIPKKS